MTADEQKAADEKNASDAPSSKMTERSASAAVLDELARHKTRLDDIDGGDADDPPPSAELPIFDSTGLPDFGI